MALFDAVEEPKHQKHRRLTIIGICVVVLGAGVLWWLLRFHAERVTVRNFMDAVVAGKMEEAYKIWKPSPSYTLKDFQDDWGPNGYYGPVRSFNVKDSDYPKLSSAVEVVVELSPYQPFPPKDDMLKQSKTKEVRLWVQSKDQSISFPPY
ncbi:MAG TPA: hypothetical protein VG322_11675 [Candidatus Acidoferrales bacterium]|nr:hypothetical protein [Candidatus Acidoferrales bacterium]